MKKIRGLGKKRASRILEYREREGLFESVKELTRTGLTENQIAQIIRLNLRLIE